MKALIVGKSGQVARALARAAPAGVDVHCLGRDKLDVRDPTAVDDAIGAIRPDLLFNAAAYTAVDRAESEEAEARAINASGVAHVNRAAQRAGARLVHVSTDFVFDGRSGSPYRVDAPTNPLNAYGRTKLEGEQHVGPDGLIVRAAWVYDSQAANFPSTILRLLNERDEVRIVSDQVGTPTFADSLAEALWALALADAKGVFHYTDSGVASWYDFAVAIAEEARAVGLVGRSVPILPISSADYPTPAIRPSYSVLDKSRATDVLGRAAPHWRENLRVMLRERLNG